MLLQNISFYVSMHRICNIVHMVEVARYSFCVILVECPGN